MFLVERVFTHVASIYANLLEQRKAFIYKKFKSRRFLFGKPTSPRKQLTFRNATTCPPPTSKRRLRNEHRNSILMTRHYLDLGSASDWLKQISHAARPIRSTTQIWVVTRHQYGISALIPQTTFSGETSGGVVKCRLFFQAKHQHV